MTMLIRGGKGDEPQNREASSALSTRSARPRTPGADKAAHDAKWKAFGRRAANITREERENFLNEIAPADRLAALEAIASHAGIDGLPYDMRELISSIIYKWGNENFDDAWASAGRIQNEGTRRHVLSRLLSLLKDKDPERAFELHMEQLALDSNFSSEAPVVILSKKAGENAEAFLSVLERLPFGGGGRARVMDFADGFDFKKVADEGIALKERRGSGIPSHFAANFFESWAKTDALAAHEWWRENGNLFTNDWSGIYKGVEQGSTLEAASRWAAELLVDETDDKLRMRMLSGILSGNQLVRRLEVLIDEMPDDVSRDGLLGDALLSDNGFYLAEFAISELSSPEARLAAITRMAGRYSNRHVQEFSDAQFAAWGLTRERVEQALPENQ